jgi:hypothetical protein
MKVRGLNLLIPFDTGSFRDIGVGTEPYTARRPRQTMPMPYIRRIRVQETSPQALGI